MTEEEKRVIEKLSSSKNETTWNDTIRQIKREKITDVVVTRQKYIKIVLNIIKKQQKELSNFHYIITTLNDNWVSKPQIRNKIKELEKQKEHQENIGLRYSEAGFIQGKINVLKELLKEE